MKSLGVRRESIRDEEIDAFGILFGEFLSAAEKDMTEWNDRNGRRL
jgi:hypothetical protein